MIRPSPPALLVFSLGTVVLVALLVAWKSSRLEADVPKDRLGEPWWVERHEAVLRQVRAQPATQLLLIGDSITNNYDKADAPDENFRPIWDQFYAPRRALNLGFSGDTTGHLLWRLQHGEVAGIAPKVALLLIGTNNTFYANHSAEETRRGIEAVIAELAKRLPKTRVLLLGVLPSDMSAEKSARDRELNALLARDYGVHPQVTYLDIGSIFYKDGVLDPQLFYDPRLREPGRPLHPDTVGQRMMAEAIEPTLARLLGDAPRVALDAMTDINTAAQQRSRQ